MEYFRSFGSRTPHESKSPVQTSLEDQDGSRSDPNLSARTFVEELDVGYEGSSHAEMGHSTSNEPRRGVISSPDIKQS